MKRLFLAVALVASPTSPADIIDDAARGVRDHVAIPLGKSVNKRILRSMADSNGPVGRAAQASLRKEDLAEKEANRGARRTVKECIKPGNVIDDDVQECVRGYREKTW